MVEPHKERVSVVNVPATSAADPRVVRIAERVHGSLQEIVESSVQRTWDEVGAYSASPDASLRDDLHRHIDAVFRVVLDTLREGRAARPEDFPMTASQATRRVRQGVGLADFLRAYRLNQENLWHGIVTACGGDRQLRDAALGQVSHVMQVIEAGASVAAQTYLKAQQLDVADGDRARRDLLEDLLAGREPAAGPRRGLLREVGLETSTRLVVASAVPAQSLAPGQSLREALITLHSAFGTGNRGLTVVRQDELIGVSPVVGSVDALIDRLTRAHAQLKRAGLSLCLGVSTEHAGHGSVSEAYAEACVARDGLAREPGIRAMPRLSTFDYLVSRPDPTVHRLIRPKLRMFVEDDLRRGGVLIATLLAYIDADLNAKIAAERLHTHVNTMYYRLDRIAARTGYDLRRIVDVQELLIAVRLLSGADGGHAGSTVA